MATIQRLNPDDLDVYRDLRWASVTAGERTLLTTPDEEREKSREDLIKILSEQYVLAAFSGGQPVGMATLIRHDAQKRRHVAEVIRVFIFPQHRGCGIAKALMLSIEEHAKSVGIECIELHVVSDNASALGLYQHLGYIVCGTLPKAVKLQDGYQDGIYMLKFL